METTDEKVIPMPGSEEKGNQDAPAEAKHKKTLIIELDEEVGDIHVKANFNSVFEAIAMLERAKHFIQKQEDDDAAKAKAQAILLATMRDMPPPPGFKRPN